MARADSAGIGGDGTAPSGDCGRAVLVPAVVADLPRTVTAFRRSSTLAFWAARCPSASRCTRTHTHTQGVTPLRLEPLDFKG